jgi:Ni,Fe-hydrogenase III large subunit
MPKKAKRTIRKMPALTREVVKVANELDRLNRRLLVLAAKVETNEHDAAALQRFMVTRKKAGD